MTINERGVKMKLLLPLWIIAIIALLLVGSNSQAMPLKDATLVVYYADWCGPCKNFKVTTDILAKEGLCVDRIDITKNPNPKINSIPRSFIHNKEGKMVKEIRGFLTPNQLRKLIRSL